MRTIFHLILFLSVLILFSCSGERGPEAETQPLASKNIRGLDRIIQDDTLRVLAVYSGTSYFLYRGKPMGFEFELLQRFSDHLGVHLDIELVEDIDSLVPNLARGKYDLVAHGLTITGERQKKVLFTDYLYLTRQVLVQKKPDDWRTIHWRKLEESLVHDAIELIGDTIHVRYNTSYYRRLQNLSEELGGEIFIQKVDGQLSTDRIIKKVLDGEIRYTVADDNLAGIFAASWPILDVRVPISLSQRIAWAVNREAPNLCDTLNAWLAEMKTTVDYHVIYEKYFENKRKFRRRVQSEFFSLNDNKISPYDALIRKNATRLDWDWRLLASLVYQESRFDPKARSWAGASGLMQMMPATAQEMGVKDRQDPADNLRGGTRYLALLADRFQSVPDSIQRIKLILAAYNCGYNHVEDAQRLAEKNDLDPDQWDGNLEKMMLELSFPEYYNDPVVRYGYTRGIEPVTYVGQIFDRYDHYKKFIDP